jgi:hypothetical protein
LSLSIIFSELQELLINFPSDARENIVSFLEDISSDVNDSRNILGIYQHDSSSDGIADKMAEELTQKMTKRIKAFNAEMIEMILHAEADYRMKIKKRS